MKKWFIVLNALVFSLWSVGVSAQALSHPYSYASSLVEENRVSTLSRAARDYIATIEPYDENWKWLHPVISGDPVPYFVDDIHDPFTYEYKVSCDRSKDCGSVVVMIIGDETRVVEASTFGKTNYERLTQWQKDKQIRFYYYSPFSQYSQNEDGNIVAINPEEQVMDQEKKWTLLQEKKDLWEQFFSRNELSFAKSNTGNVTSNIMGVVNVQAISHDVNSNCKNFKLPCYDQFAQMYGSEYCWSWCAPTAFAIIFGYYDRLQVFPNLVWNVSVLAPSFGSSHPNLVSMVNAIRWHMHTFCGGGNPKTWLTQNHNIALGMQYARDRGYTNSQNGQFHWGGWSTFPIIQNSINGAKPLVANFGNIQSGHSVVILGYNNTGNINTSQIHINAWWGNWYSERFVLMEHPLANAGALSGYWMYSIVTVPVTW